MQRSGGLWFAMVWIFISHAVLVVFAFLVFGGGLLLLEALVLVTVTSICVYGIYHLDTWAKVPLRILIGHDWVFTALSVPEFSLSGVFTLEGGIPLLIAGVTSTTYQSVKDALDPES